MKVLHDEGYNTAAKNQPVITDVNDEYVLCCYGEKTIEDQLYKKLIFFCTSNGKCLYFEEGENYSIDYAIETNIDVTEAEHEKRDAYIDTGSFVTSVEKVTEYCHGLVPDEL